MLPMYSSSSSLRQLENIDGCSTWVSFSITFSVVCKFRMVDGEPCGVDRVPSKSYSSISNSSSLS